MTSLRSPDPEIFLRAAEALDHEWLEPCCPRVFPIVGCCPVIARACASSDERWSHALFFARLFKPGPEDYPSVFPEPYERAGYWWGPDEREPRLIALCLAAAILEDEQALKPKTRGNSLRRAAASASLRIAAKAGTRRRQEKRGPCKQVSITQ